MRIWTYSAKILPLKEDYYAETLVPCCSIVVFYFEKNEMR